MFYHELLAKHITDNNFGYCTVDEFKAITLDEDKTKSQINIEMDQPEKGKFQGADKVVFGIYVKYPDAKVAREKIEALEAEFDQKLAFRVEPNTPVFQYTKIITKPSYWGKTNSNNFIYWMRIQSLIINS